MSHMPLESTASGHGVKDAVDKLTPHLNGKVELNVAGHTHRYRIVEKSATQAFPIIVGGNNKEEGATVIRVDATKTTINVTIKNHAGEELGKYELKK